ncbi:MAG TPA: hypothetical protein VF488_10715, partial [Gemmatimonadaceae bacterium]
MSHPKVEAKLRLRIAHNQRNKSECLTQAHTAIEAARSERAASARSVALDTLRAIPLAARIPEEVARIDSERAACTAEATRRREERVATAATRDIRELRSIDPSFLLAEERARIAADDAERTAASAAHAAVLEKRQADPRWMGPVLSAAICVESARNDRAAKEIRTELEYARKYGGVVDKSKLYDLQQLIRGGDRA